MTITLATTAAEIMSQLVAALPGDIIEVTPGAKGSLNRSGKLTKAAPGVTIRAQKPLDKPVFGNSPLRFDGVSGVTFDGLIFRGTNVESTIAGVQYPAGTGPIVDNFDRITFRNCTFDFYLRAVQAYPGSNLLFDRCQFIRCGMDMLQCFDTILTGRFNRTVFTDPRINLARQSEAARHPDPIQFAVNGSKAPSEDITIEYCYHSGGPQTGKGPFFGNQRVRDGASLAAAGYKRVTIRHNLVVGGRTHGIFIFGGVDCVIEGNLLRKWPGAGVRETPRISIYGPHSGTIVRDNVAPLDILFAEGGSAGDITQSGNVWTSNTSIVPPGWVDLVPGVNCGPDTDDPPPEPPTRPTIEAQHGRIGAMFDASDQFPGLTGGVLIIPSTSPAFAAGQNPGNFRWIDASLTTPKPFRLATPPVNRAGSLRFEMQGGDGGTPVYCRGPGETHAGILWAYTIDGSTWSEYPAYAGSYTVALIGD